MKFKIVASSVLLPMALLVSLWAKADNLVILHTNDFHSQIDPKDDGKGGVFRLKALVDSVRACNDNVLLIDAGDVVQGTLFFNLFGGEVESKVMNQMGYDIAIVGNHEFDNGVECLARNISGNSDISWITTNYNLDNSALKGLFSPYVIKEYDSKRIAFIGINIQPKGMIAEGNYDGVVYLDPMKAANSTAWHLKHNEKVDMIVALTHVGYDEEPLPNDVSIAANSEDIDLIIGGHTHTTLVDGKDRTRIANLSGKEVLVAQTGSKGVNLGEIVVNLDDMSMKSRLIEVDSRLDSRGKDEELVELIQPYRHSIDSVMAIKIGRSKVVLDKDRLLNLFSDAVLMRGEELAGNVDLSIINKGGIRRTLPKGDITKGMIMTALPFVNHITVMDIYGKDLLDAFNVMARRDGDGVGGDNVEIIMSATDKSVKSAKINGKEIDPEQVYRVATIDYLAKGGDYMEPLTRGKVIAKSENILYDDVLASPLINGNKRISASPIPSMRY